jgi:hypothetical protein
MMTDDPARPAPDSQAPDISGEGRSESRPRRLSWRWQLAWPWLIVVAVALAVVSPFLVAPPLSHDHPVHIFKAWHFWTEMLGRGRLRGWSPFCGFGYPSGELTPFGPEAWVAIFRLATLGALSWMRTYGIAFAGTLMFATLATFAFTRRQFGPGAAVVAAILNILDPGDWAEGGWAWHTTYGVWPVTLAMGFVLFAVAKLDDVLSTGRPRDIYLAGASMAASLLVHQLPLTVYPVVVPLLILDRRLRDGRLAVTAMVRLLSACAVGFGLAAFYVVPMMTRTSLTQDLGVMGISVGELGEKIGNAALFGGMWPPVFALGVLGAVLAVRNPGQLRLFVPLAAFVFVLLSSNVLIHELHLERLVTGLIKIEARRFLLVAKLFWFALVGHAIATIFRLTRPRRLENLLSRRSRRIGTGLLLMVAAPLAWPAARQLYRTQIARQVQTPAATPFWSDLANLLHWSDEMRRSTAGVTPAAVARTAYALPMHDHLSAIAPVFDGSLVYKVGYTPAQQFNRFPMSDEPALLEALSVKFLVSDHDIVGSDFTLDRSFGSLRVYRFNRFHPEPFLLMGGGHASLRSFEPESISIETQGTNDQSRLRLNVASYPRWRATLNGAEVPITTVAIHDSEYPMLMEVPVHDGKLEFRYVRRWIDWLGLALTLLTLMGLSGAALSRGAGGRWGPLRWLPFHRLAALPKGWRVAVRTAPGRGGRTAWAIGSIAAVVIGAGLWLTAKPPLSAGSLFLSDASITVGLGDTPCQPAGPASWQCGADRIEPGVRSGLYGTHFCMSAPPVGRLVVISISGKAPSFVSGSYDTVGGPGHISVDLDERRVGQIATRDTSQGLQFFKFDTRPDAGKPVTLRITLEGAPLHCFDSTLVR